VQDREHSFDDGKEDVNVTRHSGISKAVLLGISDRDIVSCPDSADVHVFRATVLGQYSVILKTFCGRETYSSFSITTGASPSKAGLRKITLRFCALVSFEQDLATEEG
jgi:hypothetical protein